MSNIFYYSIKFREHTSTDTWSNRVLRIADFIALCSDSNDSDSAWKELCRAYDRKEGPRRVKIFGPDFRDTNGVGYALFRSSCPEGRENIRQGMRNYFPDIDYELHWRCYDNPVSDCTCTVFVVIVNDGKESMKTIHRVDPLMDYLSNWAPDELRNRIEQKVLAELTSEDIADMRLRGEDPVHPLACKQMELKSLLERLNIEQEVLSGEDFAPTVATEENPYSIPAFVSYKQKEKWFFLMSESGETQFVKNDSELDKLIITECPFCSVTQEISVCSEDYSAWEKAGIPAQIAFSYLSANDREAIISGICPECWVDVFEQDEDE